MGKGFRRARGIVFAYVAHPMQLPHRSLAREKLPARDVDWAIEHVHRRLTRRWRAAWRGPMFIGGAFDLRADAMGRIQRSASRLLRRAQR